MPLFLLIVCLGCVCVDVVYVMKLGQACRAARAELQIQASFKASSVVEEEARCQRSQNIIVVQVAGKLCCYESHALLSRAGAAGGGRRLHTGRKPTDTTKAHIHIVYVGRVRLLVVPSRQADDQTHLGGNETGRAKPLADLLYKPKMV